jgi:two-component system cell cycle sensor histidine kinase/response regulator CckA
MKQVVTSVGVSVGPSTSDGEASAVPFRRHSGGGDDQRRILIVEDEALIAMDLERRLIRLGYDVVSVVDNYDDALAAFTRERPDIVLMDINLANSKSGIEVAFALRKISDTPVVFITAYNDDQTVKMATSIAPYGYLIKPFDDRSMTVTIRVALERHAADRQVLQYSAAMNSANVGIVITNARDGLQVVTYANDAYRKMLGDEETELSAIQWLSARDNQDVIVQGLREAVGQGKHASGVYVGTRTDGTTFSASVVAAPVQNSGGAGVTMVLFHLDVTQQREVERALANNQRLELFGRLAAGIAHDFNNVLGAIICLAEVAREADSVEASRGDLDAILHSAQSGARLTRKLLNAARPQNDSPSVVVDLSRVLRNTMPMIERLAGGRIKVELNLDPQPMFVQLDATSVEQIILNLVTNARDAMEGAGSLAIAARAVSPLEGADSEFRRVSLTVKDDGCGMSPETLTKIFDPFFTTKNSQHGTGLGLGTTKSLVERAGGTVSVQSTPGQGSVFTLEFRMASGIIDEIETEADFTQAGWADGALCLLVEDEPELLRVYSRALVRTGFNVLVASTGAAALNLLGQHKQELRLLVTDMVLPGMSGARLLERVAIDAPNAARMVVTGYFDDSAEVIPVDVPIIFKPCTASTVARRALGAVKAGVASRGTEIAQGPPKAVESVTPSGKPAGRAVTAPVVLVVDEDDSVRIALSRVLTSRGFVVLEAVSAKAALQVVQEVQPSVLMTEVRLTDMDGLDLLAALRRIRPRLPAIIFSGQMSNEDTRRAIDSRVSAFLSKPIDSERFYTEVDRAIKDGHVAELQHQLLLSRVPASMVEDLPATERQFSESVSQLQMAYQPIVRAHDYSIFAYEALARSRGPLESPDKLLAAAEILGRIDELGQAIRRSIADTLSLHTECLEPVFVNLHPAELRGDLLVSHGEPLLKHSSRVIFEVTERAQLTGEMLQETLERIRNVGYRIALDDLGEGYAGLSWLIRLLPDFAKIDMSLVRDIQHSKMKRELVASLVIVCRRAGTVVVAEGVESFEEATVLKDIGCDLLQGYLFARPGLPFPSVAPVSFP